METLPLSKLRPCNANPRRSFDAVTIEGLSRSIKTDGLLQNLVVAKPDGKQRKYTIISGERRYRALCLLVANGDLSKDTRRWKTSSAKTCHHWKKRKLSRHCCATA